MDGEKKNDSVSSEIWEFLDFPQKGKGGQGQGIRGDYLRVLQAGDQRERMATKEFSLTLQLFQSAQRSSGGRVVVHCRIVDATTGGWHWTTWRARMSRKGRGRGGSEHHGRKNGKGQTSLKVYLNMSTWSHPVNMYTWCEVRSAGNACVT